MTKWIRPLTAANVTLVSSDPCVVTAPTLTLIPHDHGGRRHLSGMGQRRASWTLHSAGTAASWEIRRRLPWWILHDDQRRRVPTDRPTDDPTNVISPQYRRYVTVASSDPPSRTTPRTPHAHVPTTPSTSKKNRPNENQKDDLQQASCNCDRTNSNRDVDLTTVWNDAWVITLQQPSFSAQNDAMHTMGNHSLRHR